MYKLPSLNTSTEKEKKDNIYDQNYFPNSFEKMLLECRGRSVQYCSIFLDKPQATRRSFWFIYSFNKCLFIVLGGRYFSR
jgi:hypothetical protein